MIIKVQIFHRVNRESQSSSYKEFAYKTRIALREANETIYWLELLDRLELGNKKLRKMLLEDIHQITLIPGSIVSKALKKIKSSKKSITR